MDSKNKDFPIDDLSESGLRFFGKMTASISHEIKNVLSIINESAGIVEDYTFLEKKGTPLDSEKISRVAQSIMRQISRADIIVKKMNRFAHSIDQSSAIVDLTEIISLVVELADRFAVNRGISIETKYPENIISVTTNPFILENLVWYCLDYAMDATGEDKTVTIVTEINENKIHIRFTQLHSLSETNNPFLEKKEKILLDVLNAEFVSDKTNSQIILTING